MALFGYTMMTEQAGPRPLGAHAVGAERAGHPAVTAQKAATMHLLSGGFRLGLGAGENLDEHVVGAGRPGAPVPPEMREEAVGIIRSLPAGDTVSDRGAHFDVDNARLRDLPEEPPPICVAMSGEHSCGIAARSGDLVIATEPRREPLRWAQWEPLPALREL